MQEGLLSVTSESMCKKYWFKLAQENVWLDCPAMTIAVDLGRKATKQKKKLLSKDNFTTPNELYQ